MMTPKSNISSRVASPSGPDMTGMPGSVNEMVSQSVGSSLEKQMMNSSVIAPAFPLYMNEALSSLISMSSIRASPTIIAMKSLKGSKKHIGLFATSENHFNPPKGKSSAAPTREKHANVKDMSIEMLMKSPPRGLIARISPLSRGHPSQSDGVLPSPLRIA